MAILTVGLASQLMNRPSLDDLTLFPPGYLQGVFADVDADIASYLQWDPVLKVHTGEEGMVWFIESGPFAGRYLIELRHHPLVPGPASTIFTSLALTYGFATSAPTAVDLTSVQVNHTAGLIYTLMPGGIGVLAQATYGWAPTLSPGSATGYIATYAAGYATGNNDPVPPGGGSYNAPAMPADIVQAAVLLARERIDQDLASGTSEKAAETAFATNAGATTGQPAETYIATQQLADWRIDYKPLTAAQATAQATAQTAAIKASTLGYGSALALAAQNRLAKYMRRDRPALVGL